jgi:hypothetical protein
MDASGATAMNIKNRSIGSFSATLLATVLLGSTVASATEQQAQERAEIPFVNHGGVRDWQAQSDDALLIRAQNGKYYRATFFGPCIGLGFANSIAFVGDVTGSLDKFGAIRVGRQECQFRTFEEVPAPAKKSDK